MLDERPKEHPGVNYIQIEMDNGPEGSSSRTQFMRHLVEFSDRHQVKINLVYFPPYHSKCNPIERVWARLKDIGTEPYSIQSRRHCDGQKRLPGKVINRSSGESKRSIKKELS